MRPGLAAPQGHVGGQGATVSGRGAGEAADDGLAAAERLAIDGLPATFTLLGENVDDLSQATAAAGEYLKLLDRIDALGMDAEVSVKLTQLGFDLEPDATMVHMERLADRSAEMGRTVWIDMESSTYVEGTIELYATLLTRSPNTGLCMQAYLHRTWDDVQKLAPLDPTIRLVKGAYREPKDVAFQDKRVIDESYFRLATHLAMTAQRLALGTHDTDLVARIEAALPGGREAFEVAMLYGIRSDEQRRLARDGFTVRTLIAYGPYWYPWFMRRIAEKPVANTLLALRNVF